MTLMIAIYFSGMFIIGFLIAELFTPRERKTWWQRVKRRHLVREVNPDNEMF
jgi:hypothetical protein